MKREGGGEVRVVGEVAGVVDNDSPGVLKRSRRTKSAQNMGQQREI